MKKQLVGLLVAVSVFGFGAHGVNAQSMDLAQLVSLFIQLGVISPDKADAARVAVASVGKGAQSNSFCHAWNSNLRIGDDNSDVSALQEALVKSDVLGASKVGFTEDVAAAVVKFQGKYGIPQTGFVGPLTRAKLNSLYGCNFKIASAAPLITSISKSSGPVGTVVEIRGTNIVDVRGDQNVIIKNAKGETASFYSGDPVSIDRSNNSFSMKLSISEKICNQWATDAGFPCKTWMGIVPGDYEIYVDGIKDPVDWSKPLLKSNAVKFTVTSAAVPSSSAITVLSPNGGETIRYGDIHMAGDLTFKWRSDDGDYKPSKFFKAYVVDADSNIVRSDNLNSISAAGDGIYASSFIGESNLKKDTNYKIKVCDVVDGSEKCDSSDGYFSIRENVASPGITVLSPNGGEAYKKGETPVIRWSVKDFGTDTLEIDLLNDKGVVVRNLSSAVNPIKGSLVDSIGPGYSWAIPTDGAPGGVKIDSGKYKIRVSLSRDPSAYDVSDNAFSIVESVSPETSFVVSAVNSSPLVINPGDDMANVLTFEARAQGASANITQVKVLLSQSPTADPRGIWYKVLRELYLVDESGRVIAQTDLNSNTISAEDGKYSVVLKGFTYNVPASSSKKLGVRARAYYSIEAAYGQTYSFTIPAEGVRADISGVNRSVPASSITQSVSVNPGSVPER